MSGTTQTAKTAKTASGTSVSKTSGNSTAKSSGVASNEKYVVTPDLAKFILDTQKELGSENIVYLPKGWAKALGVKAGIHVTNKNGKENEETYNYVTNKVLDNDDISNEDAFYYLNMLGVDPKYVEKNIK